MNARARRPARRPLWILAVALIAGCRGAATPARVSAPEHLTLAVRADATGIFPNAPAQAEGFTYTVNDHLFEGLVALGRESQLVPALAERWTTPDDHRWLFTLRRGVLFSDGSAVSAADVVASFRATLDRPFPNHRSLSKLRGVGEGGRSGHG